MMHKIAICLDICADALFHVIETVAPDIRPQLQSIGALQCGKPLQACAILVRKGG